MLGDETPRIVAGQAFSSVRLSSRLLRYVHHLDSLSQIEGHDFRRGARTSQFSQNRRGALQEQIQSHFQVSKRILEAFLCPSRPSGNMLLMAHSSTRNYWFICELLVLRLLRARRMISLYLFSVTSSPAVKSTYLQSDSNSSQGATKVILSSACWSRLSESSFKVRQVQCIL